MTRRTAVAPLTLEAAIRDRNLLGALAHFRDASSWAAWCALDRAMRGLPLTLEQERLVGEATGGVPYRPGRPAARVLILAGRQSGKSTSQGARQALDAAGAARVPVGSERHAVTMAQDLTSALRSASRAQRGPLEGSPVLAQSVARVTVETCELTNRVRATTLPCRAAAIRGLTCIGEDGQRVGVYLDELAHMRASETGQQVDRDVVRAALPSLAVERGVLVATTTPYGESGVAWEWFKRHYGRADAEVLVLRLPAWVLNPRLDRAALEELRELDPVGYRQEVLAEFVSGAGALLDDAALEAVTPDGVREIGPTPGQRVYPYLDVASGTGADSWAAAVATRDARGGAVLLAVREWSPPFNPEQVAAETAAFLWSYGCAAVQGDKYAGGLVVELLRKHRVTYTAHARDRSQVFLDFLPLVMSGRVQLLAHERLLAQLRGLQRRRGFAGKD